MLQRIQATLASLPPAEQRVAKLLIEDPTAFSTLPIGILSDRACVSKPTILRFCRSLGYSGFNDFRMKLNGVVSNGFPLVHPEVSENDKVSDVAVKVIDSTLSAVQQFRGVVDSYALARAVHLLAAVHKNNARVLILGVGISALVGQDAHMKLRRIGLNVSSSLDSSMQLIEASAINSSDAVLVFSNSGRTKDMLEITDLSKRKGAAVIAVSSSRSPLASVADVHLAIDHSEGYGKFSPMVSRLIQLLVVDIVVTALAVQLGSPELSSKLAEVEKNLGTRRFS